MGLYSYIQMQSSQAMGLVHAVDMSTLSFLQAGEAIERLWLKATDLGLSIQPMTALPIFFINLFINDGKIFTADQRPKVKNLKEKFSELEHQLTPNELVFLFRIGYAQAPTVHSLRRPIESFISS